VTAEPAPDLAPEDEVLLAIGKLHPSPADVARAAAAIARPRFPWEAALALATANRVDGLIARAVEAEPALRAAAPREVRRALGKARLAIELRNARIAGAVAAPLESLAAAGLPVALMKGGALSATVFPPGTRVLNDLDLLIRRSDYARVARSLEAAGFAKSFLRPADERDLLHDYHELSFVKRFGPTTVSVDLHWLVYHRLAPFTLRAADVIARARPARFGGARCLAMSPEDTLVHYATQLGVDHLHYAYGRVADIDALARSGLDWARVLTIARAAGAEGVTRLALGLAETLGARPPSWLLHRLAAASPGSGRVADFLADPRLLVGRRRIREGLRILFLPLLYTALRARLAYFFTLPWVDRGSAHVLHLEAGDGVASLRAARIEALVGAAGCGAALLLARGLGRFDRAWPSLCPPAA
jgi:hypothetical protein